MVKSVRIGPETTVCSHWDTLEVSLPHLPHPTKVSSEGLLLLSHVEAELVVHTVSPGRLAGSLLTVPAHLVLLEAVVEVGAIVCITEGEGKAAVRLLAACLTWEVEHLCLYGGVGEATWASLAREGGRGRLERIYMWRQVLKRGRRWELRMAWRAVERGWGVGEEWVDKGRGIQHGWERIEKKVGI